MSKEIYINNIPFRNFNFVENNENLIVAESLKEEFFGVSLLKIFGEEILCEQVAQDIVSCNLKIDDNEYKNIKFKVIIESNKKSKIAINVHSLNNPEPIIISKKELDLISEDFVSHYSESKLDFSKDVEKIKEKDLLIEELENEILNLKRLNRDEKIITEEKVYKLIEQNIENKILNPETYEGSEIILKAVKSLIEENSEGKLDDFRKNLFEDLKKTSNDSIENAVKRIRRYVDTMSSGGSVAKQYAKGGTMDGDLNVNGAYLSGGKNLDQIFITTETDSQNLIYRDGEFALSITGGNTISLSSLANRNDVYTAVVSNSADWNQAHNIATRYQEISGDFATNTTLDLVSSVLTPLALTNALTSQLVLNTDFDLYKTEVASATASNINYAHSNFLPLTGGTISGPTRINNDLTVFGNLTATGITTFANTIFSTTSALSVVHVGSGPAMWVGNNGDGDIASFYDIDENVEILHIGGINSSNPNVGIKVSNPNKDLTVKGELSASSTIYDDKGNSEQWNSSYTTVCANSGSWDYQGTDLKNLSSNWQSTYTTFQNNSSTYTPKKIFINRLIIDSQVHPSGSIDGRALNAEPNKFYKLTISYGYQAASEITGYLNLINMFCIAGSTNTLIPNRVPVSLITTVSSFQRSWAVANASNSGLLTINAILSSGPNIATPSISWSHSGFGTNFRKAGSYFLLEEIEPL